MNLSKVYSNVTDPNFKAPTLDEQSEKKSLQQLEEARLKQEINTWLNQFQTKVFLDYIEGRSIELQSVAAELTSMADCPQPIITSKLIEAHTLNKVITYARTRKY